ncbi:MAG: hypothetical protein Q7V20_07135 [Aquabacterium sp.]|uniref:lipopolysaccharide biosynthesis protein n=1 Tax=Aquabacterium sp. TaxID=1872578 RepID=UPI002725E2FE|nr:hypothetical protein [Aquabacterium sp.]MDO9003209.1 hypothetical protein [Aquabacterium sp.]
MIGSPKHSDVGDLMSEGADERKSPFHGVSYSLIDQGLLSISNFLIGLAFIKFATKHDYYAYSQLIGYVALTLAIQAALVTTTSLTLLPQKRGLERLRATNVFFGLQLSSSVVLAIFGGFFLWTLPASISMDEIGWPMVLAMALMVLSSWLREFLRNVQFINGRADLCLQQDMAYVLTVALGVVWLVYANRVRADEVLLVIGAAGVISAIPWLRKASTVPVFSVGPWSELWREIWPLARWSLPAGLVAWASGNGYLLIGAHFLGPESTAEIVAAKLFTAPLGMVFLSWSNVFRPKVSHWISMSAIREVARLTRFSMMGVAAVVGVYLLALVVAYPVLESGILGEKYLGLHFDIAWWGLFFMASGFSSICNGVLLAGGHFRRSFYAALISALFSIPVMCLTSLILGKNGLMLGVVLGEATYAAVLYVGMRRMLRGVVHPNQSGVVA